LQARRRRFTLCAKFGRGGAAVATLKEFEDALREQGMHMALAILSA
jgi:hypothetical protein